MPLWNDMNLCAPNSDFCSYDLEDISDLEVVSNLVSVLTRGADQLGSGHPVWDEVKVFHALQSRLALKLPCDKFLHLFQRICSCLRNLVMINLSKLCLDLAETFLSGMSCSTFPDDVTSTCKSVRLPSRQQLEFLLIRIQGTAKLVCQTLNYSEETFLHLIQRLSVGHMTHCLLMASSAVARARYAYKALLLQLCDFYKELKPFCCLLKLGTWQWPCELELPEDMLQWLNPEKCLETCRIVTPDQLDFLHRMFKPNEKAQVQTQPVNFVDAYSKTDCDIGEVKARDIEQTENGAPNSESGTTNVQEDSDFVKGDEGSVSKSKENTKKHAVELCNLFKIIKKAQSVQTLLVIAQELINHNSSLYHILPKPVDKKNIGAVKRTVRRLKYRIRKLKQKKILNKSAVRIRKQSLLEQAKHDFISLMGLFEKCESSKKLSKSFENSKKNILDASSFKSKFKPVSTLSQFTELFHCLNKEVIQIKKDARLSKKLTRRYESYFEDAKILCESGKQVLAQKLIFRLSKKLISLCNGKNV